MSEPAPKRDGQRERILVWLHMRGPQGVLNTELTELCMRYGARIHELRQAGYDIRTERIDESRFRFVLVEPKPLETQPIFIKEGNWGQQKAQASKAAKRKWLAEQLEHAKQQRLFA